VLGSEITLTAAVVLPGLRPVDVVVQAVLGRVDSGDTLSDPRYIDMIHTGGGEGPTVTFSATTPLPQAGSMGYTVRVLPRHRLLAEDAEFGLVTLAGDTDLADSATPAEVHL